MFLTRCWILFAAVLSPVSVYSFGLTTIHHDRLNTVPIHKRLWPRGVLLHMKTASSSSSTEASMEEESSSSSSSSLLPTRRNVLLNIARLPLIATTATTATLLATSPYLVGSAHAVAATARPPLGQLLYMILRVREATEQETRLLKTGKFKDVQRANIKLAVRFMVENYRLADTLVAASAYIEGGSGRRIEAGQLGQNAVQNLLTILEYFDAADVQNLKVGSDSLAGKEQIVLRGLEATRRNLDDFLAYFPASEIDKAKKLIQEENSLNEKEFDASLGVILNLRPVKQ